MAIRPQQMVSGEGERYGLGESGVGGRENSIRFVAVDSLRRRRLIESIVGEGGVSRMMMTSWGTYSMKSPTVVNGSSPEEMDFRLDEGGG